MSCSANKIATPVNGVCSSTVTGAQPSPLSNGACNVGPVIGFNASGTNPVNYTWKCGGQNGGLDSPNCTASYTLPPPLPVCSSTVIGNLPGPIFAGVCNSGSPGSFTAVGTNPVNYTWKCSNAINQFVNCSASFTPPPPLGFALSLKKYVNLDDAQPASPVPVLTNDTFNYVIKVKNNGPGPSSGESTVTDIIPLGVVFNGSPSGAGWSCTTVAFGVTCKSSAVIAAGALYPDISIPVKVTALIGTITNTAQVSNPEDVSNTP